MKRLIALLVATLMCFGTLALCVFLDSLGSSTQVKPKNESDQQPEILNSSDEAGVQFGVTNILVLGVDNDNQSGMSSRGNADGIMLVSINPETEEIIITSFLRDTRVLVDGVYYDKLTSVFHSGDIDLFEKTFEENFDIPIDWYVQFNYLDIIEIVDYVGGIDVNLSPEEIYYMDGKIKNLSVLTNTSYSDNQITVDQAGVVHLNGIQTAAYMRIRPAEGNYDFGRTERIRTVVSELFKKTNEMKPKGLLNFSIKMIQNLKTDVSANEIMQLAKNIEQIKSFKRISSRIPIDNSYSFLNDASGSFVEIDFEINKEALFESIYYGKR